MTDASELRIRAMRPDEITIALDWAAAEGWNPGLADAPCFATVDRDGFLIGELDGFKSHGTKRAFRKDRRRDRRLSARGFTVIRITDDQIRDEPSDVAADLRHLLPRSRT